jgi:hypothetical protein
MNTDELLAAIETAVADYLDGRLSSVELQARLVDELEPPDQTPTRDPAAQLWYGVLVNLVFYHHCDFEREMLETSLRRLIESVRSTGYGTLTPITSSQCFVDAVNTGAIPAPLDPTRFTRVG